MLFYEYFDFFQKRFKSQPLKKEISKEMTIQRESICATGRDSVRIPGWEREYPGKL